ncbi:MAG: 3-isopropylmalate dehydratase large subunit [Chloroflexi bacterium]|nr:3-isopropylmalate dehydratase large subunit [Chloroflexota bacterium]
MAGRTFAEKALARAAGMDDARAGDIVDVTPDLMLSHDNSAAISRIFQQTGAPRILHPERIAITLDHAAPAPTTRHAENHAEVRVWAQEHGITHLFEVGRGICHQVISEEGLVLPGETVLGADSHTTHAGWLGAFGAGVGRTEMAALWATGQLWMRVPEAIRIMLSGRLARGVTAKDLALYLLGILGANGALYRSVEFAGDGIAGLSLDARAVLPNMMAEAGAKNAYLPPDDAVFDYLAARRTRDYTPLYPDADASYAAEHHVDLTAIPPQIALPSRPDRVVPLSEALGQPVHQAFIGTCTNGRLEDLRAAAEVLQNQRVRCRLIVIPASAEVLRAAAREGIIDTLVGAGAAIGTPGCGPCMGNHMGVPAPDEVTISSGSRNFRGRMGTANAPVYLASPYVVAASAIEGRIADPRETIQ